MSKISEILTRISKVFPDEAHFLEHYVVDRETRVMILSHEVTDLREELHYLREVEKSWIELCEKSRYASEGAQLGVENGKATEKEDGF